MRADLGGIQVVISRVNNGELLKMEKGRHEAREIHKLTKGREETPFDQIV